MSQGRYRTTGDVMRIAGDTAVELFLFALTLYREARNQSYETRLAVAASICNRVTRPAWWGADVISVLTKREQYTSMNTKRDDPNLRVWPTTRDRIFGECLEIATLALDNRLDTHASQTLGPVLTGADSYFDDSLPEPPWWARQHPDRFVGRVGAFSFYNMDEDVESKEV